MRNLPRVSNSITSVSIRMRVEEYMLILRAECVNSRRQSKREGRFSPLKAPSNVKASYTAPRRWQSEQYKRWLGRGEVLHPRAVLLRMSLLESS